MHGLPHERSAPVSGSPHSRGGACQGSGVDPPSVPTASEPGLGRVFHAFSFHGTPHRNLLRDQTGEARRTPTHGAAVPDVPILRRAVRSPVKDGRLVLRRGDRLHLYGSRGGSMSTNIYCCPSPVVST